MTPVEALELALSKEKASIILYKKFAANYPEIRDLLFDLLTEEEKHEKRITEKLSRMKRG